MIKNWIYNIILIRIEIEILIQSAKSKIHKPQACFWRNEKVIHRINAKIHTHTIIIMIIIVAMTINFRTKMIYSVCGVCVRQ